MEESVNKNKFISKTPSKEEVEKEGEENGLRQETQVRVKCAMFTVLDTESCQDLLVTDVTSPQLLPEPGTAVHLCSSMLACCCGKTLTRSSWGGKGSFSSQVMVSFPGRPEQGLTQKPWNNYRRLLPG